MNTVLNTESDRHFTAAHLGRLDELMRYRFNFDGRDVPGKVFLKEPLGLTGMEMSWNSFPPGASIPFLHAHREHEEVYLFIAGEGEFMVDGRVFPVGEGSVVRVAPDGERAYRNTGAGPLHFVVLQVRQNSLAASTIDDGYLSEKPLLWPEPQPV